MSADAPAAADISDSETSAAVQRLDVALNRYTQLPCPLAPLVVARRLLVMGHPAHLVKERFPDIPASDFPSLPASPRSDTPQAPPPVAPVVHTPTDSAPSHRPSGIQDRRPGPRPATQLAEQLLNELEVGPVAEENISLQYIP